MRYTLVLEPSLTLLTPAWTWLLPLKLGHTLGHLLGTCAHLAQQIHNSLYTLLTIDGVYLVITRGEHVARNHVHIYIYIHMQVCLKKCDSEI